MALGRLCFFFSNIGLSLEVENSRKEYIKLLNQFTIIVFFLFLLHSINNFLIIQDYHSGLTLLCIALFFPLTFLFPKLRRVNGWVCSVFIALCLIVFFYESYSGLESGIYLYYFPIMLATPFVFEPKKDLKYIVSIILFILLAITTNIFTDYNLFTNSNLSQETKRNTFKVSLITSSIIVLINIIFIIRKNLIIDKLYNIHKSEQTHKSDLLWEIKELGILAKENDSTFFLAFNEIYPDFSNNLLLLSPSLTILELELCALIKLGFSTKEIAQNTKLSIRAIEGRKYRIRKKLNFTTEKEMVIYMLEL